MLALLEAAATSMTHLPAPVGPFVPFSLAALGSHSWSKSSQGVERLGLAGWGKRFFGGGFSEAVKRLVDPPRKVTLITFGNMSPSKKRGRLEDTLIL